MFQKSMVFAALSIAFMAFSLLIGIFRLMALNSLGTGILGPFYGLHSIIMVFGFLAAMIMTERLAGLATLPIARNARGHTAMVPLTVLGLVAETLGYILGLSVLKYVGAILLVAGCITFFLTLRLLRQSTDAKLSFDFMMLSVVSLTAAAVASAFSLPVYNIGFIMLLIAFPVLFVLGERIELTRFVSSTATASRFRLGFALSAASIVLFMIESAGSFLTLSNLAFLSGSVLLIVVFLLVLITENRNLGLLLKSRKPLQRYVAVHVRLGYVWGLIGMILAVSYSLSGYRLDLYDPFIHAMTIGFVGTMMLGHGPVILPTVIGRRFDEQKLTMIPSGTLTFAVLVRVFGELVLLAFNWAPLRLIVGLSGWLVAIAVILFIQAIIAGIRQTASARS